MRTLLRSVHGTLALLPDLLRSCWQVDRRLTLAFFGTAALAAVLQIATGVTFKHLVDAMVNLSRTDVTIPLAVVAVVAVRYAVHFAGDLVRWILHDTYFAYLFRWRVQNHVVRSLAEAVSHLDVPHLENAETQSLIATVRDNASWRVSSFLERTAHLLFHVVALVSAIVLLVPYGWWIPLAIILLSLPRLWVRARCGELAWSIYGSGAPQVKQLHYQQWLLSDPAAIRETRIFRSQEALLERFRGLQDGLFDLNRVPLDRFRRWALLPMAIETLVLIGLALVLVPQVAAGVLTLGAFTLYLGLIETVNGAAGGIVNTLGSMGEDALFVRDYRRVLTLPPILVHAPSAPTVPRRVPRIEFEEVCFAYADGPAVLDRISFAIEPGQHLALVGINGAGKSTIIKLLCRFYDPTAGRILIDGVDLRDLDLPTWHACLGTLFQDFVRFHFTVRDNILLGDPRREDEAALRRAAELAGAHDFITRLPRGYDQALGREFDGGLELSVGQWQKLAIARAFYQLAPVLIMDEPTSAVDAESEAAIFANLEHAYRERTVIFISHRFSTVRNADRILVLAGGRIIEDGTHADLMGQEGLYARMYRTQAKGYLDRSPATALPA